MVGIMWHRRDLRTTDNTALYEALSAHELVIPVFVIDPFFFREERETCNDRIRFMIESLQDLRSQYKELGCNLVILYGDSLEELEKLRSKYDASIYYNFDTNMSFGFQRDKEVSAKTYFNGYTNDAIIRESYDRRMWKANCETYMQGSLPSPRSMKQHVERSTLDLEKFMFKYPPMKTKVPKGGSTQAWKRLRLFKQELGLYMKSISKPSLAEKHTSRLSAYYSFGCISLRESFHYVKDHPQARYFLTRLYWNQHFTQKLEDFKDLATRTVNPLFEKHYDTLYKKDEEKIRAWKEGKTGYPLIDASMRALVQTGWLNFRMRAMVASFFVYILAQPWQIGADFMHYHLIDADVAINYAQWQMQAGLIGAHPHRIYNPTKQIIDNDSQGTFIREYVLELKDASNAFLQRDPCQLTLDPFTYIAPIVNFEVEAKRARTTMKKLDVLAKKVLSQPEVFTRASLSTRFKKSRA